jgi:hypothetical protein
VALDSVVEVKAKVAAMVKAKAAVVINEHTGTLYQNILMDNNLADCKA